MPSSESVRTLRTLLLPMTATTEKENECAQLLEDLLQEKGLSVGEYSEWAILNLEHWREKKSPTPDLLRIVPQILSISGEVAPEKLSIHYFSIHKKLSDEYFFKHDEGRWFLSHSFMILEMAVKERLSAAQIARMMAVRDRRAKFSRHTVQMFLSRLGMAPTLSPEEVESLFKLDSLEEAMYFADASLDEAAHMLATAGQALGYAGSLAGKLTELAPQDEIGRHSPYLQILHFQCTLAEYFDHAVTDFYEFSPRGRAVSWLLDAYPQALSRAGNPFLNNAKSVERADASWVRMKKTAERPGTAALLGILDGLETMGFSARRELARLIRLWIHRVIRLSKPFEIELPLLTEVEWRTVLDSVKQENSQTYGIIEQRVVDALSWGSHINGWRARGLGAAVNATNISTRRLGDCDYQSADRKFICAYESHGGVLTDIYVDEHLRTLKKSFELRKEELKGIADLREWTIQITFIAHELRLQKHVEIELEDANVEISFKTFESFIEDWLSDAPNFEHLNQKLILPLRENRTPLEVRRKLLDLADHP